MESIKGDFVTTNLQNVERWGARQRHPIAPFNAAGQAWFQGDYRQAEAVLKESVSEAQNRHDQRSMVLYSGMWATLELSRGNFEQAGELVEEVVTRARTIQDKWYLALLLAIQSKTEAEKVETLRQESRELLLEVERQRQQAHHLYQQGKVARLQGHFTLAHGCFEESLRIYREIDDRWEQACLLGQLGQLEWVRGKSNAAISLSQTGLRLASQVHTRPQAATLYWYLGYLALLQSDYSRAEEWLEQSRAVTQEMGDKAGLSLALASLGDLARQTGNYRQARTRYQEALVLHWRSRNKAGLACLVQKLARLALAENRLDRALTLAGKSLSMHLKLGYQTGLALSLETLAAALVRHGQTASGVLLLGQAQALREICHLAPNSDEEATVKAALAEAHSNLDSSRFSQNWSQGRTLSLEEVLQLALLSSKTGLDTVNVGFDLNLSLKRARRSKIGGPVMRLTPRELEVLRLVATGMTDAQVAENLGLSTLTVSSYLRSIYSKLGVTSRTAAVHAARARNLVST